LLSSEAINCHHLQVLWFVLWYSARICKQYPHYWWWYSYWWPEGFIDKNH